MNLISCCKNSPARHSGNLENLERRLFMAADPIIFCGCAFCNPYTQAATPVSALVQAEGSGLTASSSSPKSRVALAVDPFTLRIAARDGVASEVGLDAGTFIVYRTGDVSRRMAVSIRARGTAVGGADYVALNDTVIFARNRTYARITIAPLADNVLEGTESLSVQIGNVDGYTTIKSKAGMVIEDNPPAVPSSFVWEGTTYPAVGRVEPQSAMIDGKVYMISGYMNNYIPNPRVDVFDYRTEKWTRLKDMPIGTTHAATAAVGTNIWLAGGYTARPGTTDRQDTYSKNVWRYDTKADKWYAGPALPDFRGSSGMVHYQGKLYLFTGDDRNRLVPRTETFVLDLNNQSAGWKQLAPIPEGRSHFGIAELNGKVYIFGGQKLIDENSVHKKTAYRYDIATNSWTRLADLPTVVSHISPNTFEYRGKIIMVGGETHFNGSIRNVREYNPVTNKYRELTPLPLARAAGSAHVWNDIFFFTGGKNNNFGRETWLADLSGLV